MKVCIWSNFVKLVSARCSATTACNPWSTAHSVYTAAGAQTPSEEDYDEGSASGNELDVAYDPMHPISTHPEMLAMFPYPFHLYRDHPDFVETSDDELEDESEVHDHDE